ncbi:MAG: hypothetical protein ABI054_11805 [Planctomycetota bacterium]
MAERSGNEFRSPVASLRAATFPRLSSIRASIAFVTLLALGACHEDPSAREWPAGTLVAIDDVPVTASEVAQDMLSVMLIEPESGEVQWKRQAFNAVSLPRAVQRAQVSKDARDKARRSIDEQFERIEKGTLIGPRQDGKVLGRAMEGTWQILGLTVWGNAMALERDQWSEVLEEPGGFVRVRLLERRETLEPAYTWLRVDRIEASYLLTDPTWRPRDEELQKHRLTILDPAWDTIVPERVKYLMGVHGQ